MRWDGWRSSNVNLRWNGIDDGDDDDGDDGNDNDGDDADDDGNFI